MTSNTIPSTLSDLSGHYVIDPAHTRIGFVARHAMVTKVRGGFNQFEGSAVVDGTDFAKSTGRVYYVPGKEDGVGRLVRFDPAKGGAPEKTDAPMLCDRA